MAACTSASGGAVDLSWRLKPSAGFAEPMTLDSFIDCDGNGNLTVADSRNRSQPILGVGQLTAIRLYWQTGDELAPPEASLSYLSYKDFQCSTENGVTGFKIMGDALLYVAPLCEDAMGTFEASACTYTAPAPVARTMVAGQTVQLGALEIVLDVGTGSASLNSCMSGKQPQPTCICATRTACP